ncbi:MAG: ABC transporter substrate-binding protein [Alphaproteobacteria bacterium]
MNKKWMGAALSALIAAAVTTPSWAEEIVLGLSFPKTGRYTTVGAATEIAVDIAVAEINAKGGIDGKKIRVEKFDTASDPKNAQVAAQRFAEDVKALAIIGPFSTAEAAVAFAAGERLEIVQMPNASSAPGLTKGKNWAWRMTEDEGKQFSRLVRTLSAKNIVKDKTAAVLYPSDEAVGKALGEIIMPTQLKNNGFTLVDNPIGFPTASFDLSPQVSKIKEKNPAVVSFAGLPEAASKVLKEVRRQGMNARMIGSQIFADPDIAEKLGPEGEGTIFVAWYWWDLNDRTRGFEKKFLEEVKKRGMNRTGAHHVDAAAYDIVYVYADAIRRGKVTGNPAKLKEERLAIRNALAATDYDGISGKVCFDKERDAELAAYVIEIKGGKRALLDSHPSDKCK